MRRVSRARCGGAAGVARGRYILFLNNDTAVCPDWLAPLVDTIASDDSVGIVGPKLLFEDGRLQEAGGSEGGFSQGGSSN